MKQMQNRWFQQIAESVHTSFDPSLYTPYQSLIESMQGVGCGVSQGKVTKTKSLHKTNFILGRKENVPADVDLSRQMVPNVIQTLRLVT